MSLGSPYPKTTPTRPPSLWSPGLWETLGSLLSQMAGVQLSCGPLSGSSPSLQAPAGLEALWVRRASRSQRGRVTRHHGVLAGHAPVLRSAPWASPAWLPWLCLALHVLPTAQGFCVLCTEGFHISGSVWLPRYWTSGKGSSFQIRSVLHPLPLRRVKCLFPLLQSHLMDIHVSSMFHCHETTPVST